MQAAVFCLIKYNVSELCCLVTAYYLVLDLAQDLSPGKKKVHFAGETKENQQSHGLHTVTSQELILRRLHAANLRSRTLNEVEKSCQFKSRQILGIR